MDALPDAPPTAVKARDLPQSPALQIIGKMKETLKGRSVGILINDGSAAAAIHALRKAAESEGATVKIVAPKVGGATLDDGSKLAADGQLAGTPSMIFDAVALVLSEEGGRMLLGEGAAIDFVRNAFGHLKAIAAAGVSNDAGVVAAGDVEAFIKAAKTRQWDREKHVRMLA